MSVPAQAAPSRATYDSTFGTVPPTNSFSSRAPWTGGDVKGGLSPATKSQGSSSEATEVENDPFLSQLEQVAENEVNRAQACGRNRGGKINFVLFGPSAV